MRGAKILVVDDDEMLLEVVERKLEGEDFRTITATTGQEALDALASPDGSSVDLVLLDIRLPDIEGTTICQQLRQHSSIPIIMLTAKSEEADRILGL